MEVPLIIPLWYFVAFTFSAIMFFLAYRSALVNLLITKQIMKQVGFLEKTRIETQPIPTAKETQEQFPSPAPPRIHEPEAKSASKVERQATQAVSQEREELIQRLRVRLEHGG